MNRVLRTSLTSGLIALAFTLTPTLHYTPGSLYGQAANDVPLPIHQVIGFAPASSTPFYAALHDSVKVDGCTLPQTWRERYGSTYPAVMIVQDLTPAGQPTWHLSAKPWSFSHIGGYVRLLCPELHARITG